jgi:hypothetical protein
MTEKVKQIVVVVRGAFFYCLDDIDEWDIVARLLKKVVVQQNCSAAAFGPKASNFALEASFCISRICSVELNYMAVAVWDDVTFLFRSSSRANVHCRRRRTQISIMISTGVNNDDDVNKSTFLCSPSSLM